jgi:hypothetical protein
MATITVVGTTTGIWRTTDGISWTQPSSTLNGATYGSSVSYGSSSAYGPLWIILPSCNASTAGTPTTYYRSSNSTTWTSNVITIAGGSTPPIGAIVWNPKFQVFSGMSGAVSGSGDTNSVYSTDGLTWISVFTPLSGAPCVRAQTGAWDPGDNFIFYLGLQGYSYGGKTTDGKTFALVGQNNISPDDATVDRQPGLFWIPTLTSTGALARWIGVGNSSKFLYNTDSTFATAWTPIALPGGSNARGLATNGSNVVFVSAGNVSYTTDYSTFNTISALPGSSTVAGCTITWTGSQYIYISSSTSDTVYTSGDGITWVSRTITGLGLGRVSGSTFALDSFITNRIPYANISLGNTANTYSITKIFGTGAGSTNLSQFYGKSNLEPGSQPLASSSAGSISMSTFGGELVLQPPSAITITGASVAGGTITWTKPYVASLCNYTYYIGTGAGGSNTFGPATTTSNGTTVSLAFGATLAGNTTYYASVVTRNVSNGVSAVGNSTFAFPGVPTLISTPNTSGTFSWTAPTTAPTGYSITPYVNDGAGTTATSGPATSYTGSTMNTAGYKYYYTISAFNAVGTSPTATTGVLNIVPAASSLLIINQAGGTSWTKPYSYTALTNTVIRYTNGTGTSANVGDVNSYTFGALGTGTSNYFTVQAFNDGGGGAVATSGNLLIAADTPGGVSLNSAGASSWSAVTNATSYAVYLNNSLCNGTLAGTSYTFSLSSNTAYTAGIAANSPGGSSATRGIASVTTVPGTPTITNFTITYNYTTFFVQYYYFSLSATLPAVGDQTIAVTYSVSGPNVYSNYYSNQSQGTSGTYAFTTAVYGGRGSPFTATVSLSNGGGAGGSATVSAAAGGPPDAATGLQWQPASNAGGWPTFWTAPAGQPTSYKVEYYSAPAYGSIKFATVYTTTNSDDGAVAGPLAPGSPCVYYVTASNASGYGPISAVSTQSANFGN